MNCTSIPLFPLTFLTTPWQVDPFCHGMARPKFGGRNGLQYGG